MGESNQQVKERLESISRHLINNSAAEEVTLKSERPKLELEDHPVDAVRSLRVSTTSWVL